MKDQTDRRVFNGYGNNAITLVQIECSLILWMTALEKLGNILFDRKLFQTVSRVGVLSNILNLCECADMQVLPDIRDMVICPQLIWIVQLSDCICQ